MDIAKMFTSENEAEFVIEVEGVQYLFAKKELSWMKLTEIASSVVEMSPKGIQFNLAKYNEQCLVAMLTKTPWPIQDTPTALYKLNKKVGEELEKHIPQFGDFMGEDLSFFGAKSNKS